MEYLPHLPSPHKPNINFDDTPIDCVYFFSLLNLFILPLPFASHPPSAGTWLIFRRVYTHRIGVYYRSVRFVFVYTLYEDTISDFSVCQSIHVTSSSQHVKSLRTEQLRRMIHTCIYKYRCYNKLFIKYDLLPSLLRFSNYNNIPLSQTETQIAHESRM